MFFVALLLLFSFIFFSTAIFSFDLEYLIVIVLYYFRMFCCRYSCKFLLIFSFIFFVSLWFIVCCFFVFAAQHTFTSYITEKLHFFVVCCSQFACSVHSCSFSSSLTVCSTFSIRKTAFRTVYSHSYESVDFETATKSDYAFKQKLFIRQYFHVAYFIGDQYEIPRDLFLFIL